jgi:hypothetical protein
VYPSTNALHSRIGSPLSSSAGGKVKDSSPPAADDKTRNPVDPVSTNTESMVWQVVVPGTQTLMLVKSPFTYPGVGDPALTVIGSAFDGRVDP